MRIYPMALSAFFALAIVFPSRAAEKPRAAQANQNQPKKIWTNDDMDQLRSRGLISIAGPEVNEAAAPTETAQPQPTFPIYNSRLEDPAWYAEKSADLQAELEKRQAALLDQQTAVAQAAKGITQPGIALDKPNAGVTPDAGIALLTAQVLEVQNQLDELSDLARQNNIPSGVLRG
jgi:hypothetical protein